MKIHCHNRHHVIFVKRMQASKQTHLTLAYEQETDGNRKQECMHHSSHCQNFKRFCGLAPAPLLAIKVPKLCEELLWQLQPSAQWPVKSASVAMLSMTATRVQNKWSTIVLSTFSTLTSDSPSAKSRTKRISPSLPWTNRSLFQNRRRIPSKGSTWVSCSKHTYQLPILDTPMQWTPGFQEEMELNWTLNFIQKRCWQQLHWLTVQIRGKLCDDQQQRHQASPS